ncbi:MAG: superoxide dismutase family protein [Chloroflexota bacterium]|nr:superoxide dismutase family protein [Chloroflexota bacterium]MDE2891939.1 superoxide dismutase family protein [Chloroflexota bacterium]
MSTPINLKLKWIAPIAVALTALIAVIATAVITAGGSDDNDRDVRILARQTGDGRTEVALQVRDSYDSWGERILPRERFLAADSEPGLWRASTTIYIEAEQAVDPAAVGLTATATMTGPDGEPMGQVNFIQGPRGVLVQARMTGVPEGWHGFHIHETGSCDPDFSAAGGHYNPTAIGHGVLHEDGHHPGDTVNLYAHTDGTANADQYTLDVTLGEGPASLFDADGSAIIVHQSPDTYGPDPAAGPRIACGVITLD